MLVLVSFLDTVLNNHCYPDTEKEREREIYRQVELLLYLAANLASDF